MHTPDDLSPQHADDSTDLSLTLGKALDEERLPLVALEPMERRAQIVAAHADWTEEQVANELQAIDAMEADLEAELDDTERQAREAAGLTKEEAEAQEQAQMDAELPSDLPDLPQAPAGKRFTRAGQRVVEARFWRAMDKKQKREQPRRWTELTLTERTMVTQTIMTTLAKGHAQGEQEVWVDGVAGVTVSGPDPDDEADASPIIAHLPIQAARELDNAILDADHSEDSVTPSVFVVDLLCRAGRWEAYHLLRTTALHLAGEAAYPRVVEGKTTSGPSGPRTPIAARAPKGTRNARRSQRARRHAHA